jgi:hypothetical protein
MAATCPFYYFRPLDNVADTATVTVQTGTEDTDYPVENLVDLSYAKIAAPAKLNEVTGAFVLDWGAAQRVDYVVIWHNFTAALAVSVQMNATNSWGAPTLTTSLTIPAKRADNYTRKVGVDLRSVTGYSTSGLRYLRINVSGSNDAHVGLKVLAFSSVRQLSRGFVLGQEDTERQTPIVMMTDARVPWAYDLNSAPRSLKGSSTLSDTDAEAMREWFRSCGGPVQPTVIVPDPTDLATSAPQGDAWLVRWSADGLTTKRSFSNINDVDIAFDEISAGDPEWY